MGLKSVLFKVSMKECFVKKIRPPEISLPSIFLNIVFQTAKKIALCAMNLNLTEALVCGSLSKLRPVP